MALNVVLLANNKLIRSLNCNLAYTLSKFPFFVMAFVKFLCLKNFGQSLGQYLFVALINYLDKC